MMTDDMDSGGTIEAPKRQYLFSRERGAPKDVEPWVLAGGVFYQMWQRRQPPYHEVAEGDVMWWVDQADRVIRWELRVANLLRSEYHDRDDAMRLLRQGYGVFPEELRDPYSHDDAGWFWAWSADVVRPVEVPLPDGLRLRQTGYTPIDADLARELHALGLPEPSTTVLVRSPGHIDVARLSSPLHEPPPRHIPLAIRRQVLDRDGRKCKECGATGTDVVFHIDHIHPWSKGGTNSIENLQVLCSGCNLSKGARVPEGGVALPSSRSALEEVCRLLGRRLPDTEEAIPSLLVAGVESGHQTEVLDAALAVLRHEGTLDTLASEVVDALAQVTGDAADRVLTFRLMCNETLSDEELVEAVRPLTTSADAWTRTWAAATVGSIGVNLPTTERLRLLVIGREGDASVRATAALGIYEIRQNDDGTVQAEVESLLDEVMQSPDIELRALAANEAAWRRYKSLPEESPTEELDAIEHLAKIALASSEDDLRAEACYLLATVSQSRHSALAYAERGARSSDPEVAEASQRLVDELRKDLE